MFKLSKPESSISGLDYYWATEEDPERLIDYLVEKRDMFYWKLNESQLFNRIQRNWEFYHNQYPGGGGSGSEIGRAGKNDQFSLIAVNHFRSLLHMLITYTIQNRPDWDAKAINSETKSLAQAEFANLLLDYYMEKKGLEGMIKEAVEHSTVMTAGHIVTLWDFEGGDVIDANPESLQLMMAGDTKFLCPNVFQVIYDYCVPRWPENHWHIIHIPENKWDLAERHPEERERILNEGKVEYTNELNNYNSTVFSEDSEDIVDTFMFIHKPTRALPNGRLFTFCGNDIPLGEPTDNYYDFTTVHRLSPGDTLLTQFGYSPGFDLQGLQEFLNLEYSTILTNHNNLGPTKIWVKYGEGINIGDLEAGVNLVQTETEPKPLNLTATPNEILQFPNAIVKEMEYVSGINAVSRGQPEAAYRSGKALAQIDAKTREFNAPFTHAYHLFLSSVGTSILKLLQKFGGDSPRLVALAGPQNYVDMKEFTAQDLNLIDHVVVQAGNNFLRSDSGKVDVATMLLQAGLISTPEDVITLIKTGQLQPLTETVDSQLTLVRQENDALRQGQLVEVRRDDNHLLHMKKHASIIDSLETRMGSPIIDVVEAHNAEHFKAIIDPAVQAMQLALGYAKPEQLQMFSMIMGMMPPAGPRQGSPPKPEGPQKGQNQGSQTPNTPGARESMARGGE